ncbi:MAG: carboxypeptidase-like regulatory domain-containing protein [Acidobacteriota bacterium]
MSASGPHQAGTGGISGTVLDSGGDVVQGANVTLSGSEGFPERSVVCPAIYRIKVSGPGMSTFTSSPINLKAGAEHIVAAITLVVSGGSTSVTVTGNKDALSEEQVRIAEQQRVVGIIPNFYSSYDWNAPPMLAKQKLQLGIRSVLDPVSFLAVAGIAGAEQYENVFPAMEVELKDMESGTARPWQPTFRPTC